MCSQRGKEVCCELKRTGKPCLKTNKGGETQAWGPVLQSQLLRRLEWEDHLGSGVLGRPGQHSKFPAQCKTKKRGCGYIAQWYSTCMVIARPWVWSSAPAWGATGNREEITTCGDLTKGASKAFKYLGSELTKSKETTNYKGPEGNNNRSEASRTRPLWWMDAVLFPSQRTAPSRTSDTEWSREPGVLGTPRHSCPTGEGLLVLAQNGNDRFLRSAQTGGRNKRAGWRRAGLSVSPWCISIPSARAQWCSVILNLDATRIWTQSLLFCFQLFLQTFGCQD